MKEQLQKEVGRLHGEIARLEGFRAELGKFKGGEFIDVLYYRCSGMIEGLMLTVKSLEKMFETDKQGDLFDE